MKAGLYIHVPFCPRKCPYCDFYSVGYSVSAAESYTEAVCRNIGALARGLEADTVYFGGGTPSVLTSEQVGRIMECVRKNVQLTDPEITLEANPSGITDEKLAGWRKAGVNRLSVGFQSGDDRELGFLGRLHNAARAEDSVLEAKRAGFDNISCDLIIGAEGQDIGSLDRTLDRLLALPISHLSAYMLKIEEGTPFDCDDIRARVCGEEELCSLYERLCERMAAEGFEHYEISNFAREGRRSRHNMKYWQLAPYLGIGPSAHSDIGGERSYCPGDIDAFLSAEVQPCAIEDASPDRAEEYVMLSLRLSEGLELGRLSETAGVELAEKVRKRAEALAGTGLVELSDGRISLTEKGFLLSNSIIVKLLGYE